MPTATPINDPSRALLVTRIIWFALLSGQVLFLAIIVVLWNVGSIKADLQLASVLGMCAVGVLFSAVTVGLFVRNQIYKRYWVGEVVTPAGYVQGNIVFLAMCEGASFLGLIAVLFRGTFGLELIVPLLALVVQVVNFPNGKAMQPPIKST